MAARNERNTDRCKQNIHLYLEITQVTPRRQATADKDSNAPIHTLHEEEEGERSEGQNAHTKDRDVSQDKLDLREAISLYKKVR